MPTSEANTFVTEEEQYDFYAAAYRDGEIEREKQIRELARAAVERMEIDRYGPISFYTSPILSAAAANFASDALVPVQTMRTTQVNVSRRVPEGFARILVAEEIIRKQLGDKV